MNAPKDRSGNRSHEIGYEDLCFEEWHMLTGLPREAYEEWLNLSMQERRDIVGISQEPESLKMLRDAQDL